MLLKKVLFILFTRSAKSLNSNCSLLGIVTNKKMERRLTNQRFKILEHLRSVKTHPSAEMVYEAVRKDLPTISLATVYRNLNLLSQEGKILKLEINNEFRFDGDISNHQHCVCQGCRKIVDLFQDDISDYAMNRFKFKDFTPEHVNVIFTGVCKDCVRKRKDGKYK